MGKFSFRKTSIIQVILVAIGLSDASLAAAHESGQHAAANVPIKQAPASIAVNSELAPPPLGVTDLKFRDFFKMPVGPGGLEPSTKLLALNGKRVRIVGYMTQQETPSTGAFILSPIPVTMGDEDESFADDLPSNAIFVHLEGSNSVVPFIPGLLKLTGVLNVGSQEEADGRVSSVSLLLDPDLTQAILHKGQERHASK